MTKHDPAEVEAVGSAILDAYNAYVEGTSSLESMGGHYTQWIHEPVYPVVLAEAAITALDAHRAPKVREAAGELEAAAFDRGCFAIGNTGVNMDAVNRKCVRARTALLAICGITNEQENA